MVDFTTHIQANPRGRRYSYAFRVRGLPYLWKDGAATWTYSDCTEIISGGLGKTDFNLDFKSDPLNPLDVGAGLVIHLVDEPSRRTRYLFSPDRTPVWSDTTIPSTAGIIPSDTTISVRSTSGLTGGEYLYLGQETVYVNSVDNSTDLTTSRGVFGTTKMKHISRFEGHQDSVRGTEISTLPTVWRGRFVDLYVAPINEDGSAGTRYTIWAGRIGDFSLTGKTIRISCDNLTASFTKDDWPEPQPQMHTAGDTAMYYLQVEDLFIIVNTLASGGVADDGLKCNLGTYNYAGGTFTAWSAAGWYSIAQICQAITDTLASSISSLDLNSITVYPEDQAVWIQNDSTTRIWFAMHAGVLGLISNQQDHPVGNPTSAPSSVTRLFRYANNGYSVTQGAYNAAGYLLNGSDLLTEEGCKNSDDVMLGYAKISDGSRAELVSFTGVALQADGRFDLGNLTRGLGGTQDLNWPDPTLDASKRDVKIEQVMCITSGQSMDAADFLLYLLLSVDGGTGLNDPDYDKLGSRFGLGYHPDHVDITGIKNKMSLGDMPRPHLFWIEEAGKGKEALEQFMKVHGIYFVTRRFERDGEYLFGLSVDLVDVPVSTKYDLSIDDAFRKADSSVDTNINERLIVNTITVTPAYEFGKKDGEAGGKIYEYAEDSINKYGASKALDIKASAQFSSFYGTVGELPVAVSMATAVSLRWFGSYATGNFTLEMECPHAGWIVQSGDRVLIDLTGVVNTNGEDSILSVAKVVDAKHNHGKNAGAKLVFRISLARAAELVPCFEVTSIASNPIVTIASNSFSLTDDTVPFASDAAPPTDILWFNSTRHTDGSGLRVYVWVKGDYSGTVVERGVTSSSVASSRLTLDSALPAGITGAVGTTTVLGCFIDYDDPTTLMAAYAYIGSNSVQSKLGTLDASTTDVEAFEYV